MSSRTSSSLSAENVFAKHIRSPSSIENQSAQQQQQDNNKKSPTYSTSTSQHLTTDASVPTISSKTTVAVDQLNPVVISKKSLQNVVFKQPISIRYLKPPTPPPPGPIVIREKRQVGLPPPPPKIVKQHLNKPSTPEPLIVRERPPTPPKLLKPVVIERRLPAPPPQPQQIIIERFIPPRKPRKIIFEKWLPYELPKRKIILQKAPPMPANRPPPRNIIVEYSSPTTLSVPEYRIEGVFKADPLTYTYSEHKGHLKVVDKIYDIPPPRAMKKSLEIMEHGDFNNNKDNRNRFVSTTYSSDSM